ncbi:MAG: penicillin amidase, partial [Myxococcota bacterium]
DTDVAAVHGFIAARDRFLQIDLGRRLGLGELSPLVGDIALEADVEAVQTGGRIITANVVAALSDEERAIFQAYAHGVNAYIAAVVAEDLDAPSEYQTLAPILGHPTASDMLEPFEVEDVAAIVTTFVTQAGYSSREIGWTRAVSQLEGLYDGEALAELRQEGVWDDVWNRVDPIHGVVSAPDFDGARRSASLPMVPNLPHVPDSLLERAEVRADARERRWHHDPLEGWGSNAWAVGAGGTADGGSLLSGDGHLDLSSPSIVWSVSLDSDHLSGGEGSHQYGVTSPGLPAIAAGTNGKVAWSSTQPFSDINDQFAEQIRLSPAGAPGEALFNGEWRPLNEHVDSYVIRDVPFVESVGRTEEWARYTLFDGRMLSDIEGRRVGSDYEAQAGETVVNMGGTLLVPEDTDDDGIISGLSFDFTGLDERSLTSFFGVREVETVEAFGELLTHTAALSQNFVVSDHTGSVMFTQFQAMPCRDTLPRGEDGGFADGANPRFVMDGTRFGGFTIPFTAEGRLDFNDAANCVIPPERYPFTINPAQGYVLSANNDPSGLSLDSNLENDDVYIGGPWEDDYRAVRIDELLGELSEAQAGSVTTMEQTQADHKSGLGQQYAPLLIDAIARARLLSGSSDDLTASETRMVDLYSVDGIRWEEVESRLIAWAESDYDTPSGVDTSYDPLVGGEEADAVATMIFNAWLPRYSNWIYQDERFPGSLLSTITGATGRTRLMNILHQGRGQTGLASHNPETGESAFFDRLGTEDIETSDEGMLLMLTEALDYLETPSTEDGKGGFGTADMDQWLWGLRHWAHFPSLLGSAFGSDGALGALAASFDINANDVAIADGIASGDPRRDVPGWPRHGDALNVDSGNPGWSGTHWDYDFGPSFRLIVALGPNGEVSGQNILPGGQSAVLDSDHYTDQVPLWLSNTALPIHWTVDEVVANGLERHTFNAP